MVMPLATEFRSFQEGDLQAVLDLQVLALKESGAIVDDPEWDNDLRNIPENYPNDGFLVAEFNNQVVGMGGFCPFDETTAEIKRMRVHPDHQKQGIGRKILSLLEEKAQILGYSQLVLNTTTLQKPAQNFYRSQGYEQYDTSIYRNKGQEFDLLWYRKTI